MTLSLILSPSPSIISIHGSIIHVAVTVSPRDIAPIQLQKLKLAVAILGTNSNQQKAYLQGARLRHAWPINKQSQF
jgi:hypothetical protein